MIFRDINAHNLIWNLHYNLRQNAGPLKELIKSYKLLVNNNIDFSLRPGRQKMPIINLALTNPGLGLLHVEKILEEYQSLFDYKLIFLELENIKKKGFKMQQLAIKR